MTVPAPTAVIVVDFNGAHGRCSNCSMPASIDTAHSCGARVIGVAINGLLGAVTIGHAKAVADICPPGVPMLGVGAVVNGPDGPRFLLTQKLDKSGLHVL